MSDYHQFLVQIYQKSTQLLKFAQFDWTNQSPDLSGIDNMLQDFKIYAVYSI